MEEKLKNLEILDVEDEAGDGQESICIDELPENWHTMIRKENIHTLRLKHVLLELFGTIFPVLTTMTLGFDLEVPRFFSNYVEDLLRVSVPNLTTLNLEFTANTRLNNSQQFSLLGALTRLHHPKSKLQHFSLVSQGTNFYTEFISALCCVLHRVESLHISGSRTLSNQAVLKNRLVFMPHLQSLSIVGSEYRQDSLIDCVNQDMLRLQHVSFGSSYQEKDALQKKFVPAIDLLEWILSHAHECQWHSFSCCFFPNINKVDDKEKEEEEEEVENAKWLREYYNTKMKAVKHQVFAYNQYVWQRKAQFLLYEACRRVHPVLANSVLDVSRNLIFKNLLNMIPFTPLTVFFNLLKRQNTSQKSKKRSRSLQ